MNVFLHSNSQEEGTRTSIRKFEPEMFYEKIKRKKMQEVDHGNAQEKQQLKRRKMNRALLSFLPDNYYHSNTSKGRRSAPMVVVNSVLHRIPELLKEMEKLKRTRDVLLAVQRKKDIAIKTATSSPIHRTPTVSVTQAIKGEVTLQIILHNKQASDCLSALLASIEQEGFSIASSSTLLLRNHTLSYSLHLHIEKSFDTKHYDEVLREKVVAWWCEKISSNLPCQK